MANDLARKWEATLFVIGVALVPVAYPAEIRAEDQRLECETVNAVGDCLGKVVIHRPDGTVEHRSRIKSADGSVIWSGPISIRFKDGSRRDCASTTPKEGWCVGASTSRRADGGKRIGTRRYNPKSGEDEWFGSSTETFANGDVLQCERVQADGRCNGNGKLIYPDGTEQIARFVGGEILDDGPRVVESASSGSGSGAARLICNSVNTSGQCDGAAVLEYPDGTRRNVTYQNGMLVQGAPTPSPVAAQPTAISAPQPRDDARAAYEAELAAQARAEREEERREERARQQEEMREMMAGTCQTKNETCMIQCGTQAQMASSVALAVGAGLAQLGGGTNAAGAAHMAREAELGRQRAAAQCDDRCQPELDACLREAYR